MEGAQQILWMISTFGNGFGAEPTIRITTCLVACDSGISGVCYHLRLGVSYHVTACCFMVGFDSIGSPGQELASAWALMSALAFLCQLDDMQYVTGYVIEIDLCHMICHKKSKTYYCNS